LREYKQELQDRKIAVAVVTFDADFMARAYVEQAQLPWPLLIDSDHSVYEAYGLLRASWWAIYGPASIWEYLKLIILKRRRVEKPGSDYRQLGGDVLIDPDGTVRFHYLSESPHDRPIIADMLAVSEMP
jgi:hypothetical protein